MKRQQEHSVTEKRFITSGLRLTPETRYPQKTQTHHLMSTNVTTSPNGGLREDQVANIHTQNAICGLRERKRVRWGNFNLGATTPCRGRNASAVTLPADRARQTQPCRGEQQDSGLGVRSPDTTHKTRTRQRDTRCNYCDGYQWSSEPN